MTMSNVRNVGPVPIQGSNAVGERRTGRGSPGTRRRDHLRPHRRGYLLVGLAVEPVGACRASAALDGVDDSLLNRAPKHG